MKVKVTIRVTNPVARALLSKDKPHRASVIPNKKKKKKRGRVDVDVESW